MTWLCIKQKNREKNSFYIYNKELREKLLFEQALKCALGKNEFKINYQVIFDSTHKPFCIEALLRWESPEFGNVKAIDFISILENNRSIIKVGEWVFREACRKLKTIYNINQQHILISVNISQYQMEDEFFVNKINNIIRETNVNPNDILMKITEKNQMKNPEQVKTVMTELKEIGIGVIALDDFGAGYSSFSNLIRLPLDIVKLDNFFVKRLYVEK